MVLILPEVVDPGVTDAGVRDSIAGVIDLEQLLVDSPKLGYFFDLTGVFVATLFNLLEGLFAFDLLQPEIGILVACNNGRSHEQ
jgi:hypothetical protein